MPLFKSTTNKAASPSSSEESSSDSSDPVVTTHVFTTSPAKPSNPPSNSKVPSHHDQKSNHSTHGNMKTGRSSSNGLWKKFVNSSQKVTPAHHGHFSNKCVQHATPVMRHPPPTRNRAAVHRGTDMSHCCPPYRSPCPPLPCKPQRESDTMRQLRSCQAELENLRLDMWRESERNALVDEKAVISRMEAQYQHQLRRWEAVQAKCARDQERRKLLLKYVVEKCRQKKLERDEGRKWRQHKEKMSYEENERLAQEFADREEQRYMKQLNMHVDQEDKFLDAQMQPRDSENMKAPILEEMRRMFAPVSSGPKEMFECFMLEPRPTGCELRQEANLKAQAMLGLRNNNGIHLNLSDRCKKKTTIQLAMGPKLLDGERNQFCDIISYPGASCIDKSPSSSTSLPKVPIPDTLKPLMKTLPFRVEEMDSELMRLERCGPGPRYDKDMRLYGTIVLPKGSPLTRFYTDPFAVTF